MCWLMARGSGLRTDISRFRFPMQPANTVPLGGVGSLDATVQRHCKSRTFLRPSQRTSVQGLPMSLPHSRWTGVLLGVKAPAVDSRRPSTHLCLCFITLLYHCRPSASMCRARSIPRFKRSNNLLYNRQPALGPHQQHLRPSLLMRRPRHAPLELARRHERPACMARVRRHGEQLVAGRRRALLQVIGTRRGGGVPAR
jgi:hypothetical protein